MDVVSLVADLAGEVAGTLRADPATRELYARDAGLYRRLPAAALLAGAAPDLPAAVGACAAHGVPLTMRGAGTSLAGQTVGRGLVVDTSRLTALRIDPERRTAWVEPGVVLDQLNAAAGRHGLAFGPDVATANRATLGGMIANNSAGARSVVHGMTADNVIALEVVLADGSRARLRVGAEPPAVFAACAPLAAAAARPGLLRCVSGYDLAALGGQEPRWPRVLCGSEGTLAVIVAAELALVPLPPARGLAVLGFPDADAALRAVPELLGAGPSAIELLDAGMLDTATGFGEAPGAALLIEQSGSPEQVAERLRALPGARLALGAAEQERLWTARRLGIARALRQPRGEEGGDPRPVPFIEDPAVPPERLAGFAAEVRRALAGEGVAAIWYGHASVGCLHIRPLMDLRRADEVARMRRLAETVADLVVAHDGSLSGEHGDGRVRGELLPRMYPPAAIAAFAELKRRLDPGGILNPGVIVDPEPLDAGLAASGEPPRRGHRTAISFSAEGGLAAAGAACNGNGLCRAAGRAMCPTYQATGDERHATRGRAVLFRAALEGRLAGGLAADGLHEALELCLGCKACAAECPAGVDLSRMKVEALAHRHRARRPSTEALIAGHAHQALALASRAPALAALAGRAVAPRLGRRPPRPSRPWRPAAIRSRAGSPVVLMADTFTRFLHPDIGDAALAVLSEAGLGVEVVDPGCCGRPALSAGLVGLARRQARRALDRLAPHALAGQRIVVLEPSCWSMLVDDLPRLVPRDPRAAWVAAAAVGFERAARDAGVVSPAGDGVVVHPHCHCRALGGAADAVAAGGAGARDSGAGCCGMAGAFGYRHGDLSRTIAERGVVPAVAGARAILAAGTSCRQQLRDVAGLRALHPAEYLAAAGAPAA